MRREIGQVRELLRDAIEKLTAGFVNVGGLIRENARDPEFAAKADREVSAIVTALQFQDLLDQLLNHSLGRLEVIEAELQGATAPAAPVAGAEGARLNSRPVAQRHLEPGDVELF